jgi:hypothetical protein
MTPASLRQGELFGSGGDLSGVSGPAPLPPPLLRCQLLEWQRRLREHQGPLFGGQASTAGQASLFTSPSPEDPGRLAADLDPLALQPQSLSFWRWPEAPHRGAAVYLVLDRPDPQLAPLLLYVGETGRADRRWKGDHDCKRYLAAYGEALRKADLPMGLSIRFWCDVPAAIAPRRALEQALIRRWLPPFNKETRERWATPFTADPD